MKILIFYNEIFTLSCECCSELSPTEKATFGWKETLAFVRDLRERGINFELTWDPSFEAPHCTEIVTD